MKTRSQTQIEIDQINRQYRTIHDSLYLSKQPIYEVSINFDDASLSWKSNKRKLKNGCYEYICGITMKNGKKCMKSNCRRHPVSKL